MSRWGGPAAPGLAYAEPVALIGRADELDEVHGVLAEATGGRAGLVTITAAAGMGATCLAEAMMADARSSDFTTLITRVGPIDRDLPYAALARALERGLDDVRHLGHRTALLDGLQALAPVMPAVGLAPPAPLGDSRIEAARVLDDCARLIERMSQLGPLALLVDELPLLDEQSLHALQYVAPLLADRPFVLITTAHAGGDAAASHALRAAAHDEGWLDTDIRLGPLDERSAGMVLDASAGRRLPDALRRRVIMHCAGRPLLLTAIGADPAITTAGRAPNGQAPDAAAQQAMTDAHATGIPLPVDLRFQVHARLAPLDDVSMALLETLAIAGRASVDVLAASSGRERTALARPLSDLAAAQMVRDDGDGWTLAHGVLRDVVLAEMGPIRTPALHARLAMALRSSAPAASEASAAAEHAVAGMGYLDPDVAADLVLAEAHRLRQIGAVSQASALLQLLAAHSSRMQVSTRVQLHLLHGHCLRDAGNDEAACAAWELAAQAARDSADVIVLAEIDQELAEIDWARGDLPAARARLRAGQARLAGLEASETLSYILHARAVDAVRVGDLDELHELAPQLDRLSRALGSPAAAARIALVRATALLSQADFIAAEYQTSLALTAAEASGDPVLLTRAHDQAAVLASMQGDFVGLEKHSRASLALARELPLLEGWPLGRLAVVDLARGDVDHALQTTARLVETALRMHEPRITRSAMSMHALALAQAGRLDAARDAVDRARQTTSATLESDRHVGSILELADVTVGLATGDAGDAARRARLIGYPTEGWLPLTGIVMLGRAFAHAGRPDELSVLIDRVSAIRSCRTDMPAAVISLLRGLRDPGAGAVGSLDAAAEGFAALRQQMLAAEACLEAAQLPEIDLDAAAMRARAAARGFDALHAAAAAHRARAVLAALGRRPDPPPTPTRPALSARELDVARLVAAGLTNGQIADRLSISPRTVSTHLDHVYRRFGFRSRVGLTRYLVDSGLIDAGGFGPGDDT
ncbi:LuxR C-terminal-related transcriptional regulator [Microbacterium sp.]|uniref:LuxR C-terminal-related transcriptional regulator n=1 Tax=Microbacterium sp. TaxID=51671 RepID=UPI003A8F88EA